MTRTLEAFFDGTSLQLKETLDLEPNTVVRVTIETLDMPTPTDFLAVCQSADLDGPADWSENLEDYSHGDSPDIVAELIMKALEEGEPEYFVHERMRQMDNR